jgi:glycyl-tRNA synthetase
VLEARLQGDKEARAAKAGKSAEEIAAQTAADVAAKVDKKKKKKKGTVVAVELADDVRQAY